MGLFSIFSGRSKARTNQAANPSELNVPYELQPGSFYLIEYKPQFISRSMINKVAREFSNADINIMFIPTVEFALNPVPATAVSTAASSDREQALALRERSHPSKSNPKKGKA